MNTSSSPPSFGSILAVLIEAQEQAPDKTVVFAELTDRFPQYAEQIRSFFVNRGKLEAVMGPRRALVGEAPTIGIDNKPGEVVVGQRMRYFGDYELLEEIARGGMGVVFKAHQVSLNRIVSVKMILSGNLAGPSDVLRFHAEAEAAANLDHPNIVPIYEVGEHEGQHYFSMKLIEGGNLSEAKRNRLKTESPKEHQKWASLLVAQVARAVHHAHQRGILHRDLKPGNILLDFEGEPHVTDFGLAKKVEAGSDLTNTGAIVGTPAYMAPEQARCEKGLSTAADVYSLGAILYELLTGRPPFQAETPLETILEVLEKEPARPRSIVPTLDPDLETITLKCLEKVPGERYGSAEALAEELERWSKGEPITARPVGHLERSWRWCRRNPAVASLTAGIAALLVVAAVTGMIIREQVHEQRNTTQAAALVKRILEAETTKVPEVISEMADYRRYVDPLLRQESAKAAESSSRKLHASLALLPVDSGQADYLVRRLLKGQPQEVVVVRDALLGHKSDHTERLWTLLENPKTASGERLRAACALATFTPDDSRWEKVSSDVSGTLVNQEPFVIASWTDALKGVRHWLKPPLEDFLTDEKRTVSARGLVAKVYGMYATGFTDAYERLEKQLEEKSAVDATVETKVSISKRKASIVTALMVMGRSEKYWPLLKHSPDPTLRSYLIDRLAPGGVDPKLLTARLEEEQAVSVKRAILLCLGEYGLDRISYAERRNYTPGLLQLYKDDSDPGIHGAVEWLLRQWQISDELKEIEKVLATGKVEGNRQWYLNRQGQTMIVVPKAGEFWMGEGNERHRTSINRSYAVASKKVTVDQFLRFQKEHNYKKEYSPTGDCPVNQISWFDAVAYCNWLSEQEGIPKDQWCYEPNKDGKYEDGMKMASDYLKRTGYRLPTEAEWEYACRAGADTGYSLGESAELLHKYAWFDANCMGKCHPVGSLKSNDLGLFDMHGNEWEWCHDMYVQYFETKDNKVIEDTEGTTKIFTNNRRVLRGGSFGNPPSDLRSANRHIHSEPWVRFYTHSFRPARTLPLGSFTSLSPSAFWQMLVPPENNAVEHYRLNGHTGTVAMAAFSSDGETLASASEDGTVKLWNWKVGTLLTTLEGHSAGVLHVNFSPDGKTLATSSRDKTVILWDLAKGEKRTTLDDHNGSVSSALYSADGKTLTTASDDLLVLVRDASGKVRTKLEGHKQPVIALTYSPDGKTLVSSGGDWNDAEKSGEVKAWDLATGKENWCAQGQFGGIWGVAYSPDGKTVAGGCLDGTVRLWDAATGKELSMLKGHTERVIWVAYTPSGKTLASASFEGKIRLWNPATGKEKAILYSEGVQRLAFSPGGTNLASTSNDQTIRIWQLGK